MGSRDGQAFGHCLDVIGCRVLCHDSGKRRRIIRSATVSSWHDDEDSSDQVEAAHLITAFEVMVELC
jgi:hypothetical protein